MSNLTDAEKALAIIKAWHDLVHAEDNKLEGILITKDWDLNTLTITTKDWHRHFGQMNSEDEKGFSILIDELYKGFCT